jgi:hypothetical protein
MPNREPFVPGERLIAIEQAGRTDFQYTSEEWAAIERETGELSDDERSKLEKFARFYLFQCRFEEDLKKARKKGANQLAKVAKQLVDLQRELDFLERTAPRSFWVIANCVFGSPTAFTLGYRNPEIAIDEYKRWRWHVEALRHFTQERSRASWVRLKSANRANPTALKDYLRQLLDFWIERGGDPGTQENSPAQRFIIAAATPAEPVLEPAKVRTFIRTEGQSRKKAMGESRTGQAERSK